MTILNAERSPFREQQEQLEDTYLAPQATRSRSSRGRDVPEDACVLRTCFQRDRDRILHSKAFRRLKHKTQVFMAPVGDHYRTRLTHTLEVAQIARTIARALRLNEDLTEAIALGHDLGHAPFGHAGEAALDAMFEAGFAHNEQSVRVVEVLEPLNLTREVRDGILHHTGPVAPLTLEGQVVKIADRVAYLNHDLDDACRAGILQPMDLPSDVRLVFGDTRGERIERMVLDLIATSGADYEAIRMSEGVHETFLELRRFMFLNVYHGSRAKIEERKVQGIIAGIYRHVMDNPVVLERALNREVVESERERATVDYIAGMTDRYAIAFYEKIYVPRSWSLTDELPS